MYNEVIRGLYYLRINEKTLSEILYTYSFSSSIIESLRSTSIKATSGNHRQSAKNFESPSPGDAIIIVW